ncbi:MFS transporter [Corynebacterium minutissimum]|uniref:MFS transporter n=1 Tax=Corynebacterium minutissimum TaxID=38301 RepID=UPI001EF339EF|nr:MFS transporter [Corynebacterium minutissimum]MCG7228496.1 MFS transporter [Corynebacterium minutissimum]MCG7237613.1 MFS transporter [Corynebacterium minutissimum]
MESQYHVRTVVDDVRGKPARPVLVLVSLVLVVASFQLNATMLSPAVTDMAAKLDTNVGVIGWSSTIFLAVAAALAIFLPPFSDLVGRKKILVISVSVMLIGTVIVLVSSSPAALIFGRALQGFVGATFALSNLTLHAMLDPKKYGLYIGIVAAMNAGVGGVDTLIGGVIVDTWGYKGIVWVILLVAILALFLVLVAVPDTRVEGTGGMDWLGALTLTGSLWCANMALTLGFSTIGWSSFWTILFVASAIVCSVGFYLQEKRAEVPLVSIQELKSRTTWGQLGTTFFALASAFSTLLYIVPAFSQDESGFAMSGTKSAFLYLMPFSLLGWALSPLVGKLAPTVGYRKVLRLGLLGSALLICCIWLFGLTNEWLLFALSFLMGATYVAGTNTPLNTTGVLYASEERPGVLPGLTSAAFNLGAGVGTGVMASIVSKSLSSGDVLSGYRAALVVGLVCAVAALLCSYLMPAKVGNDIRV